MRAVASQFHRLKLKPVLPRLSFERTQAYYLPRMIEEHVPKYFPCATLLPEIDTNPDIDKVLCPNEKGFPQFDKWDLYCTYMGIGRYSYEQDNLLADLLDKLEREDLGIDETLKTLDELTSMLNFAWNCARLIYTTQNHILNNNLFENIFKHATRALEIPYQSTQLINFFKKMEEKGGLDVWQQRLIQKFKSEHKNAGLEMKVTNHSIAFMQVHSKLAISKEEYENNLRTCLEQFYITMKRPEFMDEFPPKLKKMMAERAKAKSVEEGPWGATLNRRMYPKILEYCPDKLTRFTSWKANIALCSHSLNRQFTNHHNVENIRKDREVLAKLHGYKNYAEYAMQSRMATSTEEVLSFISDIGAEARQTVTNEADVLKDLAAANGQHNPLEDCDVPFWIRQQKKIIYSIDEDALCQYFPFDHVWGTMTSFVGDLFGVQITEYPPQEVPTYHPDVRTFKVSEKDGTYIGDFYLDPYERPKEKLEDSYNDGRMITLRNRSAQHRPLVALIFNFMAKTEENPQSLLNVDDLRTLFFVFGQALQNLLSKSPYSGVSGSTNMEWDVLEMTPRFMTYWLHNADLVRKLSCHHSTGEKLSESTVTDLISSYSVGSGFRYCEQILRSHYDIRLHSEEGNWLTILRELWPQYSPFVFDETHSMATWFSDIFLGAHGGGYYDRLWSDMLAADTFNAFKDASPEKISELGLKYREAFLSTGGGRATAVSFQEFMGRDPNLEALFQLNKLV